MILMLIGLGDCCYIFVDCVDLSFYIEDVVLYIEMEGLDNVDLLGWSYGGMVILGVYFRILERIWFLIFFDVFMFDNGMLLVDLIDKDRWFLYDVV